MLVQRGSGPEKGGKVNHSAGHAATHSYWDTTHWYSWRDAFGTLVLAEMQHYRPHSVFI
jgi:hypothetical protein